MHCAVVAAGSHAARRRGLQGDCSVKTFVSIDAASACGCKILGILYRRQKSCLVQYVSQPLLSLCYYFQSCYATRADTYKLMTNFRLHSKALLTTYTSWQLLFLNTKKALFLNTNDLLHTKDIVHNQFHTEIVDLRVDLNAHVQISV